jgi:ankyrin repeat protein
LDNSPFADGNGPANDANPLPSPEMGNGTHPLSPPLETALRHNKLEAAQLLVERGANVNDQPFLWQCAKEQSATLHDQRLDSVRFLLRSGANVNRADRASGETPLWAAAKNGHVQLVKEFLKARADVRIRDNNGETPLGVAYRLGHKRIVYLLLRTSPHVWPKVTKALVKKRKE